MRALCSIERVILLTCITASKAFLVELAEPEYAVSRQHWSALADVTASEMERVRQDQLLRATNDSSPA